MLSSYHEIERIYFIFTDDKGLFMGVIKNISAYYTGKIECSKNDTKLVPASVYSYTTKQKYWFISGILNSEKCRYLHEEIQYPAEYISYLFMLKNLFIDMGMKVSVNYNPVDHYLKIPYESIKPHVKKLHLTNKSI